jgi:DNA-binding XRE family transcriptional regulator
MYNQGMETQELLRELRAKGWGDSDLADALGVSRVTVYRWRHGQIPDNPIMLGLSLRWLLRRARPPRRKDLALGSQGEVSVSSAHRHSQPEALLSLTSPGRAG